MDTNENIEEVDTDVEVTEEVVTVVKPKATKPKAPKKPQDRKPKAAPKPKPDALTAQGEADEEGNITLTVKDIEVSVDKEVLDDFELMEHVMAVDMGDTHAIVHAGQGLRKMLGLEQYETVMAELRKKTGRANIAAVLEFFVELIRAILPNS